MQNPSNTSNTGRGRPGALMMAPKLAYRNLFQDRISLLVTLVGIVFSVVLVAVQCGLYLGAQRNIASVLDRADGQLWIMPIGTKSFDDPSFLPGREKYAALATPGVKNVSELAVGFSRWRKPDGGNARVLLVGVDFATSGLNDFNIVDGQLSDISAPGSVIADQNFFSKLGISGTGDTSEVNGINVSVTASTKGIRSFTTLPYVFTTLERARDLLGATPDQSTYTLVNLAEGADLESVRQSLASRLPDTEVLTQDEFRTRSQNYWLFQTGAGAALIAGAILGLIVGVVIVAQTLYASTKDHLNEFATLRALGASKGYINQVILIQALLSAVIGYALGLSLALMVIWAAKGSTLNIVMTPGLAGMLLAVTVGMCIFAAVSAILKVIRIDPAAVFSR